MHRAPFGAPVILLSTADHQLVVADDRLIGRQQRVHA